MARLSVALVLIAAGAVLFPFTPAGLQKYGDPLAVMLLAVSLFLGLDAWRHKAGSRYWRAVLAAALTATGAALVAWEPHRLVELRVTLAAIGFVGAFLIIRHPTSVGVSRGRDADDNDA